MGPTYDEVQYILGEFFSTDSVAESRAKMQWVAEQLRRFKEALKICEAKGLAPNGTEVDDGKVELSDQELEKLRPRVALP